MQSTFVDASAVDPTNVCQICEPTASTDAWTTVADGTGCGSGHQCSVGACVPIPAGISGTVLITDPDRDGTKISLLSVGAKVISGTCSGPGWSVVVSGAVAGSTTCKSDQTWTLPLDFSSAADGTAAIVVMATDGSGWTQPSKRTFLKDTVFCANPANATASPFAGGSGTSADPYSICTTAQALSFSSSPATWGASFRLRNDIDLSGQLWPPVDLSGDFDGDGFTVNNLSIDLPGTTNVDFSPARPGQSKTSA